MKNDTRQLLAEALMRLLQVKPINKITVIELTEESNFSRMTFYYYFQDIYDLVIWIFEENAKDILEKNGGVSNWPQSLKELLQLGLRNKNIIMNIYRYMSPAQVEQYLTGFVEPNIESCIRGRAAGIPISENGLKSIITFYSHILVGAVVDWVNQGMSANISQLVNLISTTIRSSLIPSIQSISQLEQNIDSPTLE
ncbi:MAG: TetR/AcrR family transcriptional regulator C-terminal domain-containing protein [Clostridia bacterium]|nr:TetR/AcrR family transcriptional regulator C-terminal domain-containing protein [Clostridia bacterium]